MGNVKVIQYVPEHRSYLVLSKIRDGRDDRMVPCTYWKKSRHSTRWFDMRLHSGDENTAFKRRLREGPPEDACRVESKVPRDSQRKRLYDWEDQYVIDQDDISMSRHRLMAYLQDILEVSGVPCSLRIKPSRRGGASFEGYTSTGVAEFVFSPSAMTIGYALHEAAHAVTDYRLGVKAAEAHGPEYLSVYIELLVKHRDMDEDFLITTAKSCNLRLME